MPYYQKLTGEKCFLSPCTAKDAEKWAVWFNNLEVTLPLGDEAYTPAPLEKMQAEVLDTIQNRYQVFSIVDLEFGALIGRCALFNLDYINRAAMLGMVIGEKEYWGKGYGQEAARLLLDYAYNLLNLHSVTLGVYAFNQRGIHAYQKIGFKEIGRQREARIIGQDKYDIILMDMLEDEFRARYPSRISHMCE